MIAQDFYTTGDSAAVYIVLVFAFWILVGGFVASAIWKNKGGSAGDGFLMGALLGILGIILAAAMTPKRAQVQQANMHRECPSCKQQIRRDASVCPFCQRESEAWTYHNGAWWVQRDGNWLYLNEQKGTWEPAPATPTPSSTSSGF